jgi:hypothetical protein
MTPAQLEEQITINQRAFEFHLARLNGLEDDANPAEIETAFQRAANAASILTALKGLRHFPVPAHVQAAVDAAGRHLIAEGERNGCTADIDEGTAQVDGSFELEPLVRVIIAAVTIADASG